MLPALWLEKKGGGGRKLQKNLINGRFSCKCFWWFWGRSNETWMAKVNYVEDENVFDYNKNLDLSSLHNLLPQSRKTRFKLTRSFHHQCAKQWWRTQRTSLLSHLLGSRALSAPTILVFSTFSRGSTDPCLWKDQSPPIGCYTSFWVGFSTFPHSKLVNCS